MAKRKTYEPLTDTEWSAVEAVLQPLINDLEYVRPGPRRADYRQVMNSLFHVFRCGLVITSQELKLPHYPSEATRRRFYAMLTKEMLMMRAIDAVKTTRPTLRQEFLHFRVESHARRESSKNKADAPVRPTPLIITALPWGPPPKVQEPEEA